MAGRFADDLVHVFPFGPCGLIAEELAHELAEFLSRRYPKVYSVTRHSPSNSKGSGARNGWYGDGRIKEITILPLGVSYNLDEEEPMRVAGLLYGFFLSARLSSKTFALTRDKCRTQDDMAIMIEGEDGEYYLQAGAILVPGMYCPTASHGY